MAIEGFDSGVYSDVCVEVVLPPEHFPAGITLERLFVGMRPQMVDQMNLQNITHQCFHISFFSPPLIKP